MIWAIIWLQPLQYGPVTYYGRLRVESGSDDGHSVCQWHSAIKVAPGPGRPAAGGLVAPAGPGPGRPGESE